MAKTQNTEVSDGDQQAQIDLLLEQSEANNQIIRKQQDQIDKLLAALGQGAATKAAIGADAAALKTEHEKVLIRSQEIQTRIDAARDKAEADLLEAPLGESGYSHFYIGLKRQDGSYNNALRLVGAKTSDLAYSQAIEKYKRFYGIVKTAQTFEVIPVKSNGRALDPAQQHLVPKPKPGTEEPQPASESDEARKVA